MIGFTCQRASGIKINAEYYRENILKTVLKPWADKHFGHRPWTLQQDSEPPHSARVNQEWLKRQVPRFISTAQQPPKSPDLNPLDFAPGAFWRVRFSLKKYQRVDHLKTALRQEQAKIPQSHFRAACDGFVGHNSYRRWQIRTNLN